MPQAWLSSACNKEGTVKRQKHLYHVQTCVQMCGPCMHTCTQTHHIFTTYMCVCVCVCVYAKESIQSCSNCEVRQSCFPTTTAVCVCVCVCAPRNPFESAQTARFNNPKVLSLLQTMSSTVLPFCPAGGAAQRASSTISTYAANAPRLLPSEPSAQQQHTHCMLVCPTAPHIPAPCIPRDSGGWGA